MRYQSPFLTFFLFALFNLIALNQTLGGNQTSSIQKSYNQVEPESILFYSKKAFEEAELNKEPELKVQAMIQLAKGYGGKANYTSAESTLNTVSDLIEFLHVDTLRAEHLLELGRIHQLQQDYIPAITHFRNALKLCKEKNLITKLVKSHIYLAEYYRNLGEFQDANSHIHAAFKNTDTTRLPTSLVIALYNRYAAIMSETGRLDSSLYFSNKAVSLASRINNKHLMAVSFNEIGFIHENKKEYDKALKHYNLAEQIWDSLGYIRNLCNVKENKGRTLKKKKEFKKSIEAFISLTEITEKQKWHDISERGFREISEIYMTINEPYKAIEFMRYQFNSGLQNMRVIDQKERRAIAKNNVQFKSSAEQISTQTNSQIVSEEKKLKFMIYVLSFTILILMVIIFSKSGKITHKK